MVQILLTRVANHKKDSPSGGCLSTALLLVGIAVGLLLLASQMKG